MINRLRKIIKGQFSNAPVRMGFKVLPFAYWRVRSHISEVTGQSDTVLKKALKEGHGIDPETLTPDTTLYFVVSQEQMEAMQQAGVTNPTVAQVMGTSECIGTDEAEVIARFKALKETPQIELPPDHQS